jgi:hypothetical protein
MIGLWRPRNTRTRTARAHVLTEGPANAPVLRIVGLTADDLDLPGDQISRAVFLRIGEALSGAEIGWVIFQCANDAVACSVDCPGMMAALRSHFGALLEASGRLDSADSATEAKPFRRARESGVTQLDLPTLNAVLAASTITGRGVRIADLPPID